ncbi:hypothetical protein RchiOBHm_Chr2g0160581 [Rosa chinensis]|uniref:Uncharacterized protein n=1 Tax=Rosa chinensis TaxID=74649 RepID=A0A2P6S2L0_ROSCH|nr:hypothetical protein RchiOBHm_Chr2g0160581 [Rosa chinensis]
MKSLKAKFYCCLALLKIIFKSEQVATSISFLSFFSYKNLVAAKKLYTSIFTPSSVPLNKKPISFTCDYIG